MAIYKNKSGQKVAVFAYDVTDGSAKTGDAANITAQISLDGGATAATNDTNPTELDATDAPGVYLFDATQAETNADLIVIAPVSATSNILIEPRFIYTEPEQRLADVTGSPLPTATMTLPGQEAPPLTPTLEEAVGWLFKIMRNRTSQTSTQWTMYANDESTVDAKATVSDDGTTAVKQEIVSGP